MTGNNFLVRSRFFFATNPGAWFVAEKTRKNTGPIRRAADVYDQILGDLGGEQAVSEAQKQLARRAAALCVACEQLEPAAAAGLEESLAVYARSTETLRRVLATLGLERRSRRNTGGFFLRYSGR